MNGEKERSRKVFSTQGEAEQAARAQAGQDCDRRPPKVKDIFGGLSRIKETVDLTRRLSEEIKVSLLGIPTEEAKDPGVGVAPGAILDAIQSDLVYIYRLAEETRLTLAEINKELQL